ncbi:MAG: secretin N-terminal domain-containing protein [Phycisphaerae bacterium]|jgi:type IV pilus assembly protein PilQ
MKFAKLKTRQRLSMFIILTVFCIFAFGAEEINLKDNEGGVLSSLEQRMQKRISVNFRNTPIDDVIRVMAQQADVDIVKSPKVVGEVTTTLTDVPLAEALSNILAAHGYGYVTSKNMIRIAPMSEINEGEEVVISRIYRITYADVSNVEKALTKFISKRGSISSNSGTNNIIVTDAESKIKAIDNFIAEIDRITPQILVEARIYDVTCTDRLDLGVEWYTGRNTTYNAAGVDDAGPNPTDGRIDPFMSGVFDGTIGKTNEMSGLLRLGWLNSAIDIDILIKAQKQVINAKLLANPRVLVLDNEEALIKIIREIPYQEITETSAGGSIGTTSFREVGVSLIVTPHVTRDDMVRLHVSPEFSVDAGDVTVGTGSTSFPQPQVDRRTAESTLLLKSGQTMVLGGLRKKEVSSQENKIPILGDLPIIGYVFKSKADESIFSEMVVFVTPWIMEQPPELNENELEIYESTEFEGPRAAKVDAEKDGQCLNCAK